MYNINLNNLNIEIICLLALKLLLLNLLHLKHLDHNIASIHLMIQPALLRITFLATRPKVLL